MRNLLSVVVYAANIHDKKSDVRPAKHVCYSYPSIKRFCTDAGYRGAFVLDADEVPGIGVDISEKIRSYEWKKLP